MAIRLHCDRCGRFVTMVADVRNLGDIKKEVICKHCQVMEEKLSKLSDSLKSVWLEQVNKLVEAAKAQLKDEISKVRASYGKDE
jgi:predicted type IV restriction endonuclease